MTRHEAIAVPQRAKLTVADFLALSERGAFDDYARAELIEGEIWVVNAIHRRHARVHATFTGELFAALKAVGSPLVLYSNPSTELSKCSLPEPDLIVAEPVDEKMVSGPTVKLAVEVSDSTLRMDSGRKARLYATHGVPEYWIVDVEGEVIQQAWQPEDGNYLQTRKIVFGEPISAATIPDLNVETAGL